MRKGNEKRAKKLDRRGHKLSEREEWRKGWEERHKRGGELSEVERR